VTNVTDLLLGLPVRVEVRVWSQEGNMTARPRNLGFIFAAALVMAVFVAITTWAAVPKHESAATFVAKGAIYRPDLWKVY
jgi:hypothetical protein